MKSEIKTIERKVITKVKEEVVILTLTKKEVGILQEACQTSSRYNINAESNKAIKRAAVFLAKAIGSRVRGGVPDENCGWSDGGYGDESFSKAFQE